MIYRKSGRTVPYRPPAGKARPARMKATDPNDSDDECSLPKLKQNEEMKIKEEPIPAGEKVQENLHHNSEI